MLPKVINYSWMEFLTPNVLNMLKDIEKEIGINYTPSKENILRFLQLDLNDVKICWVAQDPFFQKGVATGRSFEINNLTSWNSTFKQVSLKNIVRLIYKTYNNISEYEDIKKFSLIKKEINEGKFPILPPNNFFSSLEKQGVLFLNTYLTCEIGKPNSHKKIWESFSEKLLTYISTKRPDLIWFLWGNEIIAKKKYIKNGIFFESRHPMLCSKKYKNDFLKSNCFKNTKDIVNWLG